MPLSPLTSPLLDIVEEVEEHSPLMSKQPGRGGARNLWARLKGGLLTHSQRERAPSRKHQKRGCRWATSLGTPF